MSKRKRKEGLTPPTLLPSLGAFRIELTPHKGGETRVLVSACEEILAYSHEEIVVRHKGTIVIVTGEGLWCRTYSPACAEVLGRVTSVALKERKL